MALPDPLDHLHTDPRLRLRRFDSTIPSSTCRYDLARHIDVYGHVHSHASTGEQTRQRMADLSISFLRDHLGMCFCMVLLARAACTSAELFQRDHLVCPEKRGGRKPGESQTFLRSEDIADSFKFGVSSGLGMFPITFDWAQIAYIGSPLLTPWWAAANVVGGLVLVMWIAAPIMCELGEFESPVFC